MLNEKIRIRLKAYDHRVLDQSTTEIVETAKRTGAHVGRCGPYADDLGTRDGPCADRAHGNPPGHISGDLLSPDDRALADGHSRRGQHRSIPDPDRGHGVHPTNEPVERCPPGRRGRPCRTGLRGGWPLPDGRGRARIVAGGGSRDRARVPRHGGGHPRSELAACCRGAQPAKGGHDRAMPLACGCRLQLAGGPRFLRGKQFRRSTPVRARARGPRTRTHRPPTRRGLPLCRSGVRSACPPGRRPH